MPSPTHTTAASDLRSPSTRATRWAAALVIACVALVYAPSLQNGFTYDDDGVLVEVSDFLSHPTLTGFFTSDYFRLSHEDSYRPIVTLTYVVDQRIGGGSPRAFHLQSLVWHLIAVACVLALLVRLGARPAVGYATAALYGVHPALTEAVDAISFREDVLVTAFGLIGVLLMTGDWPRRSAVRVTLGTLAFAAAMFSKESAVVFLALLPLTDWAMGQTSPAATLWTPAHRKREYAAFAICAVLYLIVRFGLLPSSPSYGSRDGHSLASSMATGVVAIGYYLRLLVYPHPLSVAYRGVIPFVMSAADWRLWASVGLIAALTVVAWRFRRVQPRMLWGWAWFLICLAPVSNVIPIPVFMAERFLHLPFVGLVAFAVTAAATLEVARHTAPRLAAVGVAGVAIVFGALTWTRHSVWASNKVLWGTALADHPNAVSAMYGYGVALAAGGDEAGAIPYFERAAAVEPDRNRLALVLLDLGIANGTLHHTDAAIAALRKSLAAAPTSGAHYYLGIAMYDLGRLNEAEQEWRSALQLQPDMTAARGSLGTALLRAGRTAEAIVNDREAVRLKPFFAPFHGNLALALEADGRRDEAISEWRLAIGLDSTQARWRYQLASLYFTRGDRAAAIAELEAALNLEPGFAEAQNALDKLRGINGR